MVWSYGRYKLLNSFSAGTVFRRQILTSKVGLRTEKVNIDCLSCIYVYIMNRLHGHTHNIRTTVYL